MSNPKNKHHKNSPSDKTGTPQKNPKISTADMESLDMQPITTETNKQSKDKAEEKNYRLTVIYPFMVSLFASAISLFALVYSCEQTNISKQSMTLGMRAYVFVDSIKIFNRKDGSRIEAIYMSNSGQTPAFNVEARNYISADFSYCPDRLRYFDIDERTISKTNIGAGSQKSSTLPITKEYFSEISKRALHGKEFLHAFGNIRYFDVFDSLHITNYAFVYDTTRKNFQVCPNNNKAN